MGMNFTAIVGSMFSTPPSMIAPLLSTPWTIVSAGNATPAQVKSAQAFVNAPLSLLTNASNAKLYQYGYTGYPESEVVSIPKQMAVCNCHQSTVPIAEYVMATILEWNVKLRAQDAAMREACWSAGPPGNTCAQSRTALRQTKSQTLGILGYGHIGQAIAQRAAGFEMRIIATDIAAQVPPPAPLSWLGDDSRNPQLFAESDFVVVALPLLNTTKGLVDTPLLGRLAKTSVLINIARGPIVSEQALYDALSSGAIGGAVLDVWWNDIFRIPAGTYGPSSWPSALRFDKLPNVIMTPHDSGDSAESLHEALSEVAANLDNLALGRPLENVVRPPQ
jgi:phosphoglycerate dehydrogenase-like enzyme